MGRQVCLNIKDRKSLMFLVSFANLLTESNRTRDSGSRSYVWLTYAKPAPPFRPVAPAFSEKISGPMFAQTNTFKCVLYLLEIAKVFFHSEQVDFSKRCRRCTKGLRFLSTSYIQKWHTLLVCICYCDDTKLPFTLLF